MNDSFKQEMHEFYIYIKDCDVDDIRLLRTLSCRTINKFVFYCNHNALIADLNSQMLP